MKQKSFLMCVILLMLTSLNFMACSDDEDVDNSISPSERKLITVIDTPRGSHKATYDDKNRLLSVEVDEANLGITSLEINYENNIISTKTKYGEDIYAFTLNDRGYIETLTYEGRTKYYTYNKDGNLIDESLDGYHVVYEWKDGNLIRNYEFDESIEQIEASCEFEYNNLLNVSGIYPHEAWVYVGTEFFEEQMQYDLIWASDLFGKKSKNLMILSLSDEGEESTYKYITNEDGYVISCTRDNEDITSYYYNE